MRILYGMTRDGRHMTAVAEVSNGELTTEQRAVLLEVFSLLTNRANACPNPVVPARVGSYVLIKRGVEDGKCFADYAKRGNGS